MQAPETSTAIEVAPGVRRLTFRLPLGIDHVHAYFLRAAAGGWTLVDTGLGLRDPEAGWGPALEALGGPLEQILVTHLHPDHIGGAADVAALTGAPVLQGRIDREQSRRVWGEGGGFERSSRFMHEHGMPQSEAEAMQSESKGLRSLVRLPAQARVVEPGEHVDGWEVVHLPGHADGHLTLFRDGTMIAGDAILNGISPQVGLYPGGRPDPLEDFMRSLDRVIERAPRVAFAGHRDPIEHPAARARELILHHRDRLDLTVRALGNEPRDAYTLSLTLFPEPLGPGQRRFALAETIAHLEHLVARDRVLKVEDGAGPQYRR
nr:MBL fold metallo-hydrolase [Actinomycetota bacterium]